MPQTKWWFLQRSGPEVIKLFSCSTQLSMKFVLINLKLLIIANSFLLNIAEHENFSANKYENVNYCWHFHIYKQRKFHAQLSWAWKKFYNLVFQMVGAWLSLSVVMPVMVLFMVVFWSDFRLPLSCLLLFYHSVFDIQSNFNGSNTFGTMEICSRHW